MTPIIAVVGSGEAINDRLVELAERIGRGIAVRKWMLVTGGKGGVMEAASRGARDGSGRVIGIIPDRDRFAANPYVEIPIATGLGEARNAVIATCCDAMIAVGGEYGTLSELAFALKLNKPVIAVASTWSDVPGALTADDADVALDMLDDVIRNVK